MSTKEKKEKWDKPTINIFKLKVTEGKYPNDGFEIPPGFPGGGLVGPGS